MKVETDGKLTKVTFPDEQVHFVIESQWNTLVKVASLCAAQESGTLRPLVSILNVYSAVKEQGINFVELTADGRYDIKKVKEEHVQNDKTEEGN